MVATVVMLIAIILGSYAFISLSILTSNALPESRQTSLALIDSLQRLFFLVNQIGQSAMFVEE